VPLIIIAEGSKLVYLTFWTLLKAYVGCLRARDSLSCEMYFQYYRASSTTSGRHRERLFSKKSKYFVRGYTKQNNDVMMTLTKHKGGRTHEN